MSNYTVTTNFGAKDSLPSGNSAKVIKGSEFTTEFTNIQTAIATKADTAGDTFTGVVNFSDDIAVNTNTLFVDVSAAKVGIGTTSPANTLTVGNLEASANDQDATVGIKCNANHKGLILQENSGAEQWSIGVGEAGSLKFYDSDSATPAVTFADISGNVGIGTDSPTGSYTTALHIHGSNTGASLHLTDPTSGATASDGLEVFQYGTDGYIWEREAGTLRFGTSATEKMRIDSSGNVGIGTDDPSSALEVNSATSNRVATFKSSDATAFIQVEDSNTTSTVHGYGVNGDNLSLYSNGTERMRIDSSGNVGIGTVSPTSILDIKGSVNGNLDLAIYNQFDDDDDDAPNPSARLYLSAASNNAYFEAHGAPEDSAGLHKVDIGSTAASSFLTFSPAGTERMRIDSSGNLLVDTTDQYAFNGGFTVKTGTVPYINVGHSSSVSHGNYFVAFRHGTNTIGTITQLQTTGVSYNTSSDERLKENIADSADAGSKVDAIQIRQFDWIADGSHQDYGVIAQELVTVAPEAVHQPEDSEEMMGVDYSKLVPMLIKEVQSLRSRVAELESE